MITAISKILHFKGITLKESIILSLFIKRKRKIIGPKTNEFLKKQERSWIIRAVGDLSKIAILSIKGLGSLVIVANILVLGFLFLEGL